MTFRRYLRIREDSSSYLSSKSRVAPTYSRREFSFTVEKLPPFIECYHADCGGTRGTHLYLVVRKGVDRVSEQVPSATNVVEGVS